MTDTPLITGENIAQTVRDVMADFDLVETIQRSDTPTSDAHLVALPTHRQIHDLTSHHRAALEYLKPLRRRGTAKLADLDSFIAWANRFKGADSAIFAAPDAQSPSLLCIADYHTSGPADPLNKDGDPTARHCAHRASYDFPVSKEWRAWKGISGRSLDKGELGDFIEANALDIENPTPAILALDASKAKAGWESRMIETAQRIEGRFGQLGQLLSLSKSFAIYESSDLSVKVNRDTGEQQIQFLNEHKGADGQPISLPNLYMITVPVFENGALFRLPVRFQYKKSGSTVKFKLTLHNPERVFDIAFREAVDTAERGTELPVFFGKPETTTRD
jgi:hypothetical protein